MRSPIVKAYKRLALFWDNNKTNALPYLLIAILALLLTCPSLHRDGIPYGIGSNDASFHMARMSGTSIRGLLDGQLVPQVDPAADNGLGNAINMFYGPLLTYVLPILRALTFSWENAYIALIFIAFFLAGTFLYKFSYVLSKNRKLSVIAAAIYMTMPYFISDVYIRGAWGEVPSFIFMPMLFLGIYKLLHSERWAVTLMWVSVTGIVLCHILSIIIVLPFAFLYLIFNYKELDGAKIKKIVLSALITIGITAFFWLPFLEARNTGLYNIFNFPFLGGIPSNGATEIKENGLSLTQYLFTDPELGKNGVTQYTILSITLLGLLSLLMRAKRIFNKNKSARRTVLQLSILAIIATTLSLRSFPWEYTPTVLWNIQFPWRFCMFTSFALSILAAYGLYYGAIVIIQKYAKEATLIVIACIIILTMPLLSTIYYAYPHIKFDDLSNTKYYTAPTILEYLPVVPCDDVDDDESCSWHILTEPNMLEPQIVSGSGEITNFEKSGTQTTVKLNNVAAGSIVRIPSMYYPGYKAFLTDEDGNIVELDVSYSENYGLLQITIPESGNYTLRTKYYNTTVTYIGLGISICTVIAIAAATGYSYIKKKRDRTKSEA